MPCHLDSPEQDSGVRRDGPTSPSYCGGMTLPRPSDRSTAVVTGASSGIGEALARELVRRGHGVTLVARSIDKLQTLADEIGTRGGTAHVLEADLSDRGVRSRLLARITELGLEPDILVNNAGVSTLGPVASSDPDAEMEMIEIDVMAVVDLCSRFLPGMVERGRGAVLNVASTGAFQPLPGQAGYGAAKAFVLSYTQGLGAELRGTGVTATTLCPGPVDTGFGERAGFTREDATAALPAFLWETAPSVARAGIDGLASGRAVVIPGTGNRAATAVGRLIPNRVLVPLLARSHPGLRS